jgi:hypothetical protein
VRYDLIVIGNDEAAFELLFAAGATGQRVIAVLPEQRHSAWMISQALRRLVSELLLDRSSQRRALMLRSGTPRLLRRLIASALTAEISEHLRLLERAGVDVLFGEARMESRDTIVVTSGIECRRTTVIASNLVIGTGIRRTARHRPLGLLPFHRPESLLAGHSLPNTLCLLGGESLGSGLAALFSLFGVDTRLLAEDDRTCASLELAHTAGVRIGFHPGELGLCEELPLFQSHMDIVDCRRAVGFTEHLGLTRIGIEPDENGLLWCANNLETWSEGVFGIGAVVGFSSDRASHPTDHASRILNRIQHRIPRPHFLTTRVGAFAMA